MGAFTKIPWCDDTRNKWIVCTKVQPECDHCYAEVSTPVRTMRLVWGPGQPRHHTGPATLQDLLRWEKTHEKFFAEHGRRRRVFMGSLMDPFDNEVPDHWHREYCDECLATPHLDKIVLTKRIGNVQKMVPKSWLEPGGWPSHVWLGISTGMQKTYDMALPKLLALPVPVRIISMEPLLEHVAMGLHRGWCRHCKKITPGTLGGHCMDPASPCFIAEVSLASMLGWVIVGGESDTGASKGRPMHVQWARSAMEQARRGGVPRFMKQLGDHPLGWCAARGRADDAVQPGVAEDRCARAEACRGRTACTGGCAELKAAKGEDPAEWPLDLRVREFPVYAQQDAGAIASA